jgi:hypothetical protein
MKYILGSIYYFIVMLGYLYIKNNNALHLICWNMLCMTSSIGWIYIADEICELIE